MASKERYAFLKFFEPRDKLGKDEFIQILIVL